MSERGSKRANESLWAHVSISKEFRGSGPNSPACRTVIFCSVRHPFFPCFRPRRSAKAIVSGAYSRRILLRNCLYLPWLDSRIGGLLAWFDSTSFYLLPTQLFEMFGLLSQTPSSIKLPQLNKRMCLFLLIFSRGDVLGLIVIFLATPILLHGAHLNNFRLILFFVIFVSSFNKLHFLF